MTRDDALLDLDQVLAKCAVCESTLRRWIKTLGFPKPVKFSRRLARWKASQVNAWIDACAEKVMR